MPVTRPGMHMNEVSMNAPIKKGAKEQVSRHLSDYVLTASLTANLGRGRESWESNECHKVARRRRTAAVKLYAMTGGTTRCCRIIGKTRARRKLRRTLSVSTSC